MAAAADLAFRDLAVVVLVAGATTLLFWKLRQPVVLGYLLAGFLVGPHSPGPSVQSEETLRFLGELGIVFLLFALGLEFNLRKLRKVGLVALVAGTIEISLMLWLGYSLGRLFGWGSLESVFLGAVVSISSTTIIVKVLAERGGKDEAWAQAAFGILLIEDVVAIVLLTVLSSAGVSGGFDPALLGGLAWRLTVFLAAALVLGQLVLPRVADLLGRVPVEEVVVVASVGAGFGLALVAAVLGFSPGLGAFLAGALMAESRHVARIEHKIVPLRDLFSGVFFVTVGAALSPAALVANAGLIAAVTAVVLGGKVVGVATGAFLAGRPPEEAVRTGMTLAQIGEFSFIIAALGVAVGAARPDLYAVAIGVSAITAFATPYLIAASPRAAHGFTRRLPPGTRAYVAAYSAWVERARRADAASAEGRAVVDASLRAFLYAAVLVALFLAGAAFQDELHAALLGVLPEWVDVGVSLGWVLVALALAPFALLCARQVRRLVFGLASLAVPERLRGARTSLTERLLRRTFGLAAVALAGGVVLAVGLPVLGSPWLVAGVVLAVLASASVLGRSLGSFSAQVERTLDRLTGHMPKDEALHVLEDAHAWGAGHREVRVHATDAAPGRTIADLRLRSLTGATVVAVEHEGARQTTPAAEYRFRTGDTVMLVGEEAALLRAEEILRGRDLGVEGGAVEVRVEAGSALVGRALAGDALEGAAVLAVRRGGQPLRPRDAGPLLAGDVLVLAGEEPEVARVRAAARSDPG